MTKTTTRRTASLAAGSAVAATLLSAALALGAPAQATTKATTEGAAPATQSCIKVTVTALPASVTNLLTRPGQLDAAQSPFRPAPPASSCLER